MRSYSQPDKRDICDDPCTRCTGDGMVWATNKALAFCGRCGGTGKEPVATAARADDPDAPHLLPKGRQPRLT